MSKRLSLLLFLGYCTLLQDVFLKPVTAEVTRDGTTNTTVDVSGNNFTIQEGERAGGNLFHSFGEFSVPTDGSAFFNNAADIVNIFSRVTGGNISNIDGLLRANGSANLFLLNPAGIVFGENARLAIGGSFFGTTADSFLFEDGEFSATDLDNPPLLTINTPIGLGLGDNPGDIENRSQFGLTEQTFDSNENPETVQFTRVTNITGLEVAPGQNLALIGGNIFLEGSGTTAPGGKVELGGLSVAGEIGINPDGSLSFPDGITRADVTLTGGALVNVTAGGGGFINVNAHNVSLSEEGRLLAGIGEGLGSSDAVAGDIVVNASESITLMGDGKGDSPKDLDAGIRNLVGEPPELQSNPEEGSTAIGNAGSIFINTNLLEVTKRADINNKVFGTGDAGDVNINADEVSMSEGEIASQVRAEGQGNSGNVNINTNIFNATDFSFVTTEHLSKDPGNAGNINLHATDSVKIQGGGGSAFIASKQGDAIGNAGDIKIKITTGSFLISGDDNKLLSLASGTGNAGNVNIIAENNVLINDGAEIFVQVLEGGEGDSGNVNITTTTGSLKIQNGSEIRAENQGVGNAGNINIKASDKIFLGDSLISAEALSDAVGNSGNIDIHSNSLTSQGSQILVDNQGRGNAGNITIKVIDSVVLDSLNKDLDSGISQILSQLNNVEDNLERQGGDIDISAASISLDNFAQISTNAKQGSMGKAGNITLNADTISVNNGSIIDALTETDFDGGDVNIKANFLELTSGGKIVTANDAGGNAGDINLNIAGDIILNNGNPPEDSPFDEPILKDLKLKTGIFANNFPGSTGDGGDIDISADSINFEDQGSISAETVSGTGGNVTLKVNDNISMRNNSLISAKAGAGDGGNLDIKARFILGFPSQGNGNDLLATAEEGDGGNIDINAQRIFNLQEGQAIDENGDRISNNRNDIDASSDFGLNGTVEISEPDVNLAQEERLSTEVVDLERLIAQNLCQRGDESEFIITGKGGMAPSPSEPRDGEISEVDLVEPAPFVEDGEEEEQSKSPLESQQASEDNPLPVEEIVQAQGWIINEQGKVRLVAYKTDPNSSPTRAKEPPVCHQ